MYKTIIGYKNSYQYFAKIEIPDPKKGEHFYPETSLFVFPSKFAKSTNVGLTKNLAKIQYGYNKHRI
jgi:hypothetical protein